MLTLRVWNLSGLAPVSDYAYDVYVGDQRIASGSVNGHTRADGWAVLVKKIVDEHIAAGLPVTREAEWREAVNAAEVIACGFLRDRDGAVCIKPRNHLRKCKFSVVRPARKR